MTTEGDAELTSDQALTGAARTSAKRLAAVIAGVAALAVAVAVPVAAAVTSAKPAPAPRLAHGCQRVVLAQNSGNGPVDHLVICDGMKRLKDAHWLCIVDGGPLVNHAVIFCNPVRDP